MFDAKVMNKLYDKAKRPEDLPWHCDEPPGLLEEVATNAAKGAKALDVGCGAGVFSVYLAKRGYNVTAIDFIPKALQFAKQRAAAANVKINWVQADVLAWKAPQTFDLVLDSGCLHNIPQGELDQYKEQLLAWTKPGSDYILTHWGKRHFLDWRPIGPRRRAKDYLIGLFSPELKVNDYEEEILSVPLPIGPKALAQYFWFKRETTRLV
jgi:SAM-dependent methyltransferase